MRFLLDEDLNPAIAEVARGLGLDVLSVHEIGRRGIIDEEQLRFSAAQNRIFLTRNRNDFIQLTLRFFQTGDPHAGLLVVSQTLPNNRPEWIAHALKRWHERGGDPDPYSIDFLSA